MGGWDERRARVLEWALAVFVGTTMGKRKTSTVQLDSAMARVLANVLAEGPVVFRALGHKVTFSGSTAPKAVRATRIITLRPNAPRRGAP